MNSFGQVVVVVLFFLISLFDIRGFLYGIMRYQLNNSAYKKRKMGENFKEWLFYSRYKGEIPKVLRILYYTVLTIHPVCAIICVLVDVIGVTSNLGWFLAVTIVIFDSAWMLIIGLFFWSPGRDYAYERWVRKKRGRKTKK